MPWTPTKGRLHAILGLGKNQPQQMENEKCKNKHFFFSI